MDMAGLRCRSHLWWVVLPGLDGRGYHNHHRQAMASSPHADDDTHGYANGDEYTHTNLDVNGISYHYTNYHGDADSDSDYNTHGYASSADANLDIHRDANADGYACAANVDTGQGTPAQLRLPS